MKTKYSNWRQELNEAALPPAGPSTPPKRPQYGLTRPQQPAAPAPAPAAPAAAAPTRAAASSSWMDKLKKFFTQPTRSGTFQQQPTGGVAQLSDPNTPATRFPSSTTRSQETAQRRGWRPGQYEGPSSGSNQPPTTPPPTTPTRQSGARREALVRVAKKAPAVPIASALKDITTQGPSAIVPALGGLAAAGLTGVAGGKITKKLGLVDKFPRVMGPITKGSQAFTNLGAYETGKTLTKDVLRKVGFRYEQKTFDQFMVECYQDQIDEYYTTVLAESMLECGYEFSTLEEMISIVESLSDEETENLMEFVGALKKTAMRGLKTYAPGVASALTGLDQVTGGRLDQEITDRVMKTTAPQAAKVAGNVASTLASYTPAGMAIGAGMSLHDVSSKLAKKREQERFNKMTDAEKFLAGYN